MKNLQSFLTIGGLLLLSITSLRFNQSILETSTTDVENKVYLTAFSLADDLIEEIKIRNFDETTKPFPTSNPASLTPADELGPETGESYPNYDDVDDFNGYHRTVDAPHAEGYDITCAVKYVKGDNPDQVINTQSFYKKVTVTVTSPYMRHAVTLSFIFTLK